MADRTSFEWTDATWNPVTGCSVMSPGCANCYAMKLAGTRLKHTPSRRGLTKDSKAGPVWTGEVRFNEQWLDQPLRWQRPRRIFVCAHGGLFAENVPDEWIDRVFAVMARAGRHTFQVLTKRSARMRQYLTRFKPDGQGWITPDGEDGYLSRLPLSADRWPLPNVWFGISAEDQARADERVSDLLATPAAVRFVSAEPLLGPIDLRSMDISGDEEVLPLGAAWLGRLEPGETEGPRLDWIIVGGESGPDARPMHPDWARSIRDQCGVAGVPFFFKQWGAWLISEEKVDRGDEWRYWQFGDGEQFQVTSDHADIVLSAAQDAKSPTHIWHDYWADGHGNLARKPGKHRAGRRLDGMEHSAFPGVRT